MSEKRAKEDVEENEQKKKKEERSHVYDMDLLKHFYETLFPYDEFVAWLTYAHGENNGIGDDLRKRELSFMLEGDVYCRYLGFANSKELKTSLTSRVPTKIDIGGQYSEPMSRKDFPSFRPLRRELVFDIDMDDYSPIRHCCTGANICRLCWKFMNNALMVLDHTLKNDFGFKHILYVFSGRRGVHVWVCDQRARQLEDSQRKAIVEYLSFNGRNTTMSLSLLEATEILTPFFEETMIQEKGQNILLYEKEKELPYAEGGSTAATIIQQQKNQRFHFIFDYLPFNFKDKDVLRLMRIIKNEEHTYSNPSAKWEAIKEVFEPYSKEHTIQKIILTYTYPRLDENVSLLRHHLLKSPFIINPRSCRICCPIDDTKLASFHPFDVPFLDEIFDDEEQMRTYEGYVTLFRDQFLRPLQNDLNIEEAKKNSQMEEY